MSPSYIHRKNVSYYCLLNLLRRMAQKTPMVLANLPRSKSQAKHSLMVRMRMVKRLEYAVLTQHE